MTTSLATVDPSQWVSPNTIKILIGGLGCLAIGVVLAEAWDFLRSRWWVRASQAERRLVWLSLIIGSALTARGKHAGYHDFVLVGVSVLCAAGAFVSFRLVQGGLKKTVSLTNWEHRTETAPGLPVITWLQTVDTGFNQKYAQDNIELKFMLGVLVGGPTIGWILGGLAGAGIGLFIACFFAPGADRYATSPKAENVGGYAPMPGRWGQRHPTELERRIDAEPIVEDWKAQAFIEVGNPDDVESEPNFVVQWRQLKTGELRVICRQPWSKLAPLELDDYDRLYGNRITALPYKAPWVVVVRAAGAPPLPIARDMAGQARLQSVFFALSSAFEGAARTAYLEKRALRLRRRAIAHSSQEPTPSTEMRQRPPL